MRKLISFCFMLLSASSIYSQTMINGICYVFDPVNNTAKVTSGGNYSGSVTVPASVTYNGVEYEVTEIGAEAFKCCWDLDNISLPNSIVSIEQLAFYNCWFENIIIPNSVQTIGYFAFGGCYYLKELYIPKSVTSIGYAAFSSLESLRSFTVDSENPVYKFEDDMLMTDNNATLVAYLGDRSLNKVTIPSTVKTIFNRAFLDCDWLTEVVIPNSVTTIDECAFSECSALSDVELPNSVRRLEMFAFENCKSIKSIEIKEGVKYIGHGAFAGCTNLTGITFPSTAATIEDWVLMNCKSLQKIVVTDGNPVYDSRNDCNALIETSTNKLLQGSANTVIPDGVTEIDGTAFEGIGLKHLYIPSSVQKIGKYSFRGCYALESIEVDPANPNYDSRDNCNALFAKESDTLLRGCSNTTFPSVVTHIGANAFDTLTGLGSLTIPEGVKSIGIYAFFNSDLVEITLPRSLEEIEYLAFQECEKLTSIHIPDGVTSLGEGAFLLCNSLTSVHTGNGVSAIPASSFFTCSSLSNITIGSSVASIDVNAFYRCDNLANIFLMGKTPPQLSEYSFWSYQAKVHVPQGCKEKYMAAPYWCKFDIEEYDPEELMDIECVTIDPVQPISRFDLMGRQSNRKDGIQILRMADGSVRKVQVNH